MDPAIWGNLPQELIFTVVEFSNVSTQIAWSCTCRAYFLAVSPIVWRSLTINLHDAHQYLESKNQPGWMKVPGNRGIINFLVRKDAFRKRTTRSQPGFPIFHGKAPQIPAQLVRHLDFDVDGDRVPWFWRYSEDISWDRYLAQRTILSLLLCTLPSLKSVCLKGALHDWHLKDVTVHQHVEYLELRTASLSSRLVLGCWRSVDWTKADLSTGFRCLRDIPTLRVLKVGQVSADEAVGIAMGIQDLKLKTLELVARVDTRRGRRPTMLAALFISFRTLLSAHLPDTLEILKLTDCDFRRIDIDISSEDIQAVLQPCRLLKILRVDFKGADLLGEFLGSVSFPNIESLAIPGWAIDPATSNPAGYEQDKDELIRRVDKVGCAQHSRIQEHVVAFLIRHRESLQHFELLDILDTGYRLANLFNEAFVEADHRAFCAQELRIRTLAIEFFENDAYQWDSVEYLSTRMYGLHRDSLRWGRELRRVRVEDVGWPRFEVDIYFDISNLQNLKLLDLRPRFQYQNERPSIFDSIICNTLRLSSSLMEIAIATQVMSKGFPNLRVIAIGPTRFWIEKTQHGRTLWRFDTAFRDKRQRLEIEKEMDLQDWRFLSEPCVEDEIRGLYVQVEERQRLEYGPVDHRTNTVTFLRDSE